MLPNLKSDNLPSPVEPIWDPTLTGSGIELLVKRDDLIHPEISGNKWRKLTHNLARMKSVGQKTLLTFGGAYSNHIYATAAAGKKAGIQTIGVIRGEPVFPLNPTLTFARDQGMVLEFVSRKDYRHKSERPFLKNLGSKYGDFYLLPEGGSNDLAVQGVSEMIDEIKVAYDFICLPVGTGGTVAGIVKGLKGKKTVLGFLVLKDDSIRKNINHWLFPQSDPPNLHLIDGYHFGGYAKFDSSLIQFINRFKKYNNLSLDPIYSGKMFFGLFELVQSGYFPNGSRVLAVHTGGLQGIKGFNQRFGNLIK